MQMIKIYTSAILMLFFLSHALVSPNSFLLLVLSRVYKLTNEPHGYIIKVMKFLLTT